MSTFVDLFIRSLIYLVSKCVKQANLFSGPTEPILVSGKAVHVSDKPVTRLRMAQSRPDDYHVSDSNISIDSEGSSRAKDMPSSPNRFDGIIYIYLYTYVYIKPEVRKTNVYGVIHICITNK